MLGLRGGMSGWKRQKCWGGRNERGVWAGSCWSQGWNVGERRGNAGGRAGMWDSRVECWA